MPYLNDLPCETPAIPLHIYFMLDVSAHMHGKLIYALNGAMRRVLPALHDLGCRRDITPLVHILSFSDCAQWLCRTTAETGVEARNIVWQDLDAYGFSNTADALQCICDSLRLNHRWREVGPRLIVQVSDGCSNDLCATQRAIEALCHCFPTYRVALCTARTVTPELEAFASYGRIDVVDGLGSLLQSQEQRLVIPLEDPCDMPHLLQEKALNLSC